MALRNSYPVVPNSIVPLGIPLAPQIQFELPRFSGTLSQLLACVREHRLALLDVPMLPICEVYLRYIATQERTDLNESAAVLAALAWLLERKAAGLLPSPPSEPEEPEPQELVERTIHEYFQAVAFLHDGYLTRQTLFFRSRDRSCIDDEIPIELESLEIGALTAALGRVLERLQPPRPEMITRAGRSLEAEMVAVLHRIGLEPVSFSELVLADATREDAVYIFLSLLELMKMGKIFATLADLDVRFVRT